jgi:sugar/nucleoside kinase (ribokinase family)
VTTIASLGNVASDVVADGTPRPGGAVFYAARAFARIGSPARITASCAAADRDTLMPPLEKLGLPLEWRESATTARYRFHYEGDRRIMQQEGVGDPWGPEAALAAVGDAEWVHVGALTRSDFPTETLAAIAEGGRQVLVDAQGLVRTTDLGPLRTDGNIGTAMRHVTILKLNDEEAETLLGTAQPEDLHAIDLPEVILTLGSRGCYVITRRSIDHVPARPVVGPVDPTGAGDTFSAAYLTARAAGLEPAEAADRATIDVAAFLSGDSA